MLAIENDHIRLCVDQHTGQIRGLRIRSPAGAQVELFDQLRGDLRRSVGGVAVYDELAHRQLSDLHDGGFDMARAETEADSITMSKRYQDAQLEVTTKYELSGAELLWRVRLRKLSGPDRSVQIYQFLPQLVGWDFWAPAGRTPFTLDGMSSFEYFYVNANGVGFHDIVMPLVAIYQPELNVGLAVALPHDAPIPAAKFQSVNGPRVFAWGTQRKTDLERMPYFEVVQYFIGLRGETPLEVSCMLTPTAGHWRPAMGWAVAKWPELFRPGSDRIHERQGIYHCGGPRHADHVEHLLRYNIRFLELHAHFPHYGLYFPEQPDASWYDIAKLEHGSPNLDRQLTVDELRRRIAALAQAGVNVYYYFQLNDGWEPWVEERFPESIAKDEDGANQPSGWRHCHNMNADLSLPWGRFQLASARKIVDAYPDLAGFFLDCWRHYELDFAHDDGITMVNNRPCYSINFHYDAITRRIAEMLHERGMETFANKPHTIRSCADVDSILMEGAGEDLEWMLLYAAAACPYYYLWTSSRLPTEEWLKRALAFGAYPMGPAVPGREEADQAPIEQLYDAYLPLYELLRRRVLSFDPDPVRFPHGTWGQLYTLPGDRYACVVVRDGTSCFDELRHHRPPVVTLRLPRELRRVRVHYPGPEAAEGIPVSAARKGRDVEVALPGLKSCAVAVGE